MVWHPLVAALLFGMFHGFVLFPHTAIAAPVAHTTAAQEFMAQGWNAWQRGAFEDAVRAWLAAAQRYEQAGQPRAQSDALTQLAHAYQALGQYRKAVQHLSSALALAQKAGDRAQTATVLGRLGGSYFVTGSLDAAQQALQGRRASGTRDQQCGAHCRPVERPGKCLHVAEQVPDFSVV